MSTIMDALPDLAVTVANNTPQLDLHPQLHNDTDAILTAVVASLAKSVEWFDVDGTIGTDATAAFRLAAASGGIVKLKANTTYTITGTITPDTDNTWVVGDGESSVIRMVGAAFNLFEVTGLNGFVLKDLYIDGSATPAPHLGSLGASVSAGATTLPLWDTHTLQSGDVVYIGNPDTPWIGYETRTLSNVTSTQATVSALTNGYGANTVVATTSGGVGGYALKVQSAARLGLRGVTFDGLLRHCVWLIDVDGLAAADCTFENFGDALVAQDPYSTFAFGVGGYGVGGATFTNCTFKDSVGRRTAGVEVRMKVNQPGTTEQGDWSFTGCTFSNLGSTGIVRANNGAGVNLVDAENSVGWRRITFTGCTWDGITDGFIWVLTPSGHVTVTGNTMTNSRHGPFIEVDAPMATITGNTIEGGSAHGGAYAGIWVRCSPGTGDFSVAGQGVDAYGMTITGNTIKDIFGANGIGIWVFGGAQVPARGPRHFNISGNEINGCTQDGIQVDLAEGSYSILNNRIFDTNAAHLATTTLTAGLTIAEGAQATLHVASVAYFYEGAFVNIAANTVNRQILHVDPDALTILLEECPTGGGASFLSGDAVVNPFAGNGGIYLNGDANVNVGTTTIRVSSLAALSWASGNALSINGESGLTISGTPVASDRGTYLVTLSGATVAAHYHGETVRNTTLGSSATLAALHTHQYVDVSHNEVGQDTLGTTRFGLYLRNVVGPIADTFNVFHPDLREGERSITGYPKLYTYDPLMRHAGWQTDASIPLETHLRDWQYRTATASSTTTTSAMTAGSTTSFTVATVPTDWAVGDFIWIEAIAQTVAGGDAVNGEVARIDGITGTTITIHSAVTFSHANPVTVYKAAYNPKLRVWGADSDNNSHGHYATLGYDENNLLMKLLFTASGHVPPANARIEVQGATSNLQFVANNNIVELVGATGQLRPRVGHGTDLGDANHVYRNVYAESIVLLTKAGAPSDSDFTSPASGMLALDTTNSRLYVRVGSSWKFVALS